MSANFNLMSKIVKTSFFLFSFTIASIVSAESSPSKKAMSFSLANAKLEWLNCPDFLPCKFAVLHGQLGGDNMDVFLKFPSKAKIPFHTHTSAEHMVMISGEFHTTYQGQEKAILKSGDFAYGPAQLPHDGFCASNIECVMFVAYEKPLDAVPYDISKKQ